MSHFAVIRVARSYGATMCNCEASIFKWNVLNMNNIRNATHREASSTLCEWYASSINDFKISAELLTKFHMVPVTVCVVIIHEDLRMSIIAKLQRHPMECNYADHSPVMPLGHRSRFMRPLRSMFIESPGVLENKSTTRIHTGIHLDASIYAVSFDAS